MAHLCKAAQLLMEVGATSLWILWGGSYFHHLLQAFWSGACVQKIFCRAQKAWICLFVRGKIFFVDKRASQKKKSLSKYCILEASFNFKKWKRNFLIKKLTYIFQKSDVDFGQKIWKIMSHPQKFHKMKKAQKIRLKIAENYFWTLKVKFSMKKLEVIFAKNFKICSHLLENCLNYKNN